MSWWRCPAAVACLFATAGTAQAKNVDADERAAKTACLAGDYAKGVAILSELYVSTNDPVFVYNQGRCFEQNHRYEDAISRFLEYLRIAKSRRADAQKHINDCEELRARQARQASPALKPAYGGTQSGASKSAKERAAKRACLTGDADGGVAILADLYVDTNDSTYIFNQGRCLEQVGRCDDAIIRFREYLRKTQDSGDKSDGRAEQHIADCERLRKQGGGSEERAGLTAEVRPGPRGTADMRAPIDPMGIEASPTQPTRGRGLRIAGAITVGVGVAASAAGVGFALAANRLADQLEATHDSYQRSKESTRASYATASTIWYSVGAACVAGGGILYYLGWRQGQSPAATIAPMVGNQSAGVLVQRAF